MGMGRRNGGLAKMFVKPGQMEEFINALKEQQESVAGGVFLTYITSVVVGKKG